MKAILSIKPEFVEKIIKREKIYEFRRKIFKKDVESIIIYASSPVKAIVGEIVIDDIINEKIDILWELTKNGAGITKNFFYEYFSNVEKGYAIKIKRFNIYENYLSIRDFGILYPPQSYAYVKGVCYE